MPPTSGNLEDTPRLVSLQHFHFCPGFKRLPSLSSWIWRTPSPPSYTHEALLCLTSLLMPLLGELENGKNEKESKCISAVICMVKYFRCNDVEGRNIAKPLETPPPPLLAKFGRLRRESPTDMMRGLIRYHIRLLETLQSPPPSPWVSTKQYVRNIFIICATLLIMQIGALLV